MTSANPSKVMRFIKDGFPYYYEFNDLSKEGLGMCEKNETFFKGSLIVNLS